ncbi:MAG: endolytic transglycosylase MltG [Bacteroides sp.]|nr:endolytic transglycosylase MltG [Bacteroides sp.]
MNKKKRNIILGIGLAIILLGATFGGIVYHYFFARPFQITETAYIYIDRDDNIDSVYQKITLIGQPKQMFGFEYQAEKNGYAQRIRTGRYAIKPGDNMRYLYRRLAMGYQTPVKLTVGSVRTLDRIARNTGRQLMIDSIEVARLMADTAYIRSIGYSKETLPALFIPNTYEVYWDMSAEDFINRMVKEHKAFWNEKRMQQAQAIGLTPTEVSTLASIVEEETANQAEKPIVAGLYINRLKRGMLLQADPTVKFSMQDFGLKRILFKHLEVDSPYNTYKYAGLPPGPIRVPSFQGLESVLNYTKHNYLYMCAKEDFSGTHNFATNSAQHAANARRYQQALNRRGIR